LYEEEKKRIQTTIFYRGSAPELSWVKLAEIYEVPYRRLLARSNGRPDRSSLGSLNKTLTDNQEAALVRIIDPYEHDGLHYRVSIIADIANFILQNAHEDPDSPPTVGVNWITNFLNRHLELRVRLSRPIAFDRQWAQDPDVLKKWYVAYKRTLEEFGVAWQDIWNFDMTGFSIGIGDV
jgi:hypothetical protein